MERIIERNEHAEDDDFNWFGFWTGRKETLTAVSSSAPAVFNAKNMSTSNQDITKNVANPTQRNIGEESTTHSTPSAVLESVEKTETNPRDVVDMPRRPSKEILAETKQESQPLFASMRQLLKPVPLSELPRSMSQDDANAIATATPSPPKSSIQKQPSASKLELFLKVVPSNQVQRQFSELSEDSNIHQTSNEIPYESSKNSSTLKLSASQNDSILSSNAPSSNDYDIFGQGPVGHGISDPEMDLFGPPSPLPQPQDPAESHQSEGISSQDSVLNDGKIYILPTFIAVRTFPWSSS